MRTWVWMLGLALVALPARASETTADEGQLKEGMPAPLFRGRVLNADAAGEKAVALEQLVASGKKAVILSFFATYCEPCKKELPFLQEMYVKYKDAGLGVMVVSIDQKPEDIAKATQLAADNKLTYPVLSDRFNIVAKRYGVKRLPCLYILDSQGKVAMVNTGYSEEFSGTLVTTVQQRLGLPQDATAVSHAAPEEPEVEAAPPAPAAAPKGKVKRAAAGKNKRRKAK